MKISDKEKRAAWMNFAAAALSNPKIADGAKWDEESICDMCCQIADRMLDDFVNSFDDSEDDDE